MKFKISTEKLIYVTLFFLETSDVTKNIVVYESFESKTTTPLGKIFR